MGRRHDGGRQATGPESPSGTNGRRSPARTIGLFLFGFIGAVAIGVMGLAVWFGITGLSLKSDFEAVQSAGDLTRAALQAGDLDSAARYLPAMQTAASDLDDGLSSAPWSWARDFPVVGDTVTAAATLAAVANDNLDYGDDLAPALRSLADTDDAESDLAATTATLAEVAPTLGALAASVEESAITLAALDTSGVLSAAAPRVEAARDQFMDLVDPVTQAAAAAEVVPGLMGMAEPARWLVILSQPAEARGSGGGFFGAMAIVEADAGTLTLQGSEDNSRLAYVEQDLSDLPEEYQRLWGQDAQYLWGYNLTRHFPYSAQIAQQAVAEGGDPTDYVLSLDPRVVGRLLALTGPVTIEGNTLTSKNAERFFTHDIYVRYPDAAEKDRITLAFLDELFAQLGPGDVSPNEVWAALSDSAQTGRVLLWADDPEAQQALERTPLAGVVPEEEGPWVTAAFNNSAGNKIDSYVDAKLRYTLTGSCESGTVTGQLTARLRLDRLPEGLPAYISGRSDRKDTAYGSSSMLVHLYGPVGATLTSFTVNGAETPLMAGREREHPVWGQKAQLPPGKWVTVQATFEQPAYAGMEPVVAPQPMVRDTTVIVEDERDCANPA